MQLFRIMKEAEKTYRLLQRLPPELMSGKEIWGTIRGTFSSPVEAEAFAHEMIMSKDSNIVKEFAI